MSQRDSGYERQDRDLYETPAWVTLALFPHLPREIGSIFEPACGSGKMLRVLQERSAFVVGSDIDRGDDFLLTGLPVGAAWDAIVTNPPYEQATAFCEHALRLMEPNRGMVAMLLRTDFDHAKGRSHLFANNPAFAKKVVLTKRIVWFEPEPGAKGKSPSFNHAWFVWDWRHEGPPIISYGPVVAKAA